MGALFVFDPCPATAMLLFATIRIQQAEGISAKSGAASKDGLSQVVFGELLSLLDLDKSAFHEQSNRHC
jgi:hypothetical protein